MGSNASYQVVIGKINLDNVSVGRITNDTGVGIGRTDVGGGGDIPCNVPVVPVEVVVEMFEDLLLVEQGGGKSGKVEESNEEREEHCFGNARDVGVDRRHFCK